MGGGKKPGSFFQSLCFLTSDLTCGWLCFCLLSFHNPISSQAAPSIYFLPNGSGGLWVYNAT